MARLDPATLATCTVELREAIVRTRDRRARLMLRDVEARLREALGPTITKTRAARVLGVSVTALERWIDRGVLPVVVRPGSSRGEVDARSLLELAGAVRRVREASPDTGSPIALAVHRLGWHPRPGGRRLLRHDVASLPRPNVPEDVLIAGFRSTTPTDRIGEAVELSHAVGRWPDRSELVR